MTPEVRAWLDSLDRQDLLALARDYAGSVDYPEGDKSEAARDAWEEWQRSRGRGVDLDRRVEDEYRATMTDAECRRLHARFVAGERDWRIRAGEREFQKRYKHGQRRRVGAA